MMPYELQKLESEMQHIQYELDLAEKMHIFKLKYPNVSDHDLQVVFAPVQAKIVCVNNDIAL